MSAVTSTMIPLGSIAPDFNLYDVCSEKKVSLQALTSPIATVIMFICNHCPYVKHIQKKLVEVVHQYQSKNISFVAINSNDVLTYPQDSPELMKAEALLNDYSFPYLYDDSQLVAKAYQATCTPDFFIFDKNLKCVYRGRFDGSTPGNGLPITGEDLCHALNALLAKKPVIEDQKASIGCSIKWKK